MTSRPFPIAPVSQHDVDAGWSSIKGALEEKRAGAWHWAWVAAAIALFVAVSAGATVLVREYRERVRRERRAPIEQPTPGDAMPEQQQQGAVGPAPSGTGSPSPVVPAADESGRADHDPRRPRDDDARAPKNGKGKGGRAAGVAGAPATSSRTAGASGGPAASSAAADGSESRGYSPLAGMSPKSQPGATAERQAPDATADGDAFAAGSAARARGDFKAALSHYERFVAKHPHDERAGIAAMEAARILADHLEQPAKALRWAEKAAELADGSVREDARARVVQLLGTLKRTGCASAQRDFLRDYPNSVHTPRVKRDCGEAP